MTQQYQQKTNQWVLISLQLNLVLYLISLIKLRLSRIYLCGFSASLYVHAFCSSPPPAPAFGSPPLFKCFICFSLFLLYEQDILEATASQITYLEFGWQPIAIVLGSFLRSFRFSFKYISAINIYLYKVTNTKMLIDKNNYYRIT